MKKIFACLLAGLLALSSLSACNNSSTESSGSGDGGSTAGDDAQGSGETVELEFVQQKREATETFDKVIEEFQAAHSNIVVKQNTVPDADQVLMGRAASNTLPDLMTHWPGNASFTAFCEEGKIIDITDADFVSNIDESYVNGILQDGKLYCIPVALNFMGVWYNVDKFTEAGYEIPKTWDEMIDIAKDIQSKGDGDYAFVLPDKDTWTIDQCLSNIYGKSLQDYTIQDIYDAVGAGEKTFTDYPELVDAAEKAIELREYSNGDTLSLGYDAAVSEFATGTGYMFPQGSWVYASLKSANPDGNFAMFTMPNDDGDMRQPMGVDLAIAGSTNTSHEDEVMEFLAFMASKEGAQKYSELDGSPSCVNGVESNLDYASDILDTFAENGELSVSFRPGTYQDDYRAETQGLLIDKDVDSWIATITEVYRENYDEANK